MSEKKSKTEASSAVRSRSKAVFASVAGVALVAAFGGVAVADHMLAPEGQNDGVEVEATSLPVTQSTFVCGPTIAAVSSQQGATDSAYAPGADQAASTLRGVALGDRGMRVPGARIVSGDTTAELSKNLPEEEALKVSTRNEQGLSGTKSVNKGGVKAQDSAWFTVQGLGGKASPAAGVRTISQKDGDLEGFASVPCTAPATSHTIVGGSTTLGQSAVLVVTNTQQATASVHVKVATKDGASASGIPDFTLNPGDTRTINLAAAASDSEAIAVSVTSTGAPVRAAVSQTVLRGLVPGGIDSIEAQTELGRKVVIPGVQSQDPAADRSAGKAEDSGDLTPSVVVYNPSATQTEAKLRAFRDDGTSVDLGTVKVEGQSVGRVATDALPAGVYSIVVEADHPVAATARMLRGQDANKAHDVAYIPGTPALGSQNVVAVPEHGEARLRIFAADDAVVTVTPVLRNGLMGKAERVDVGAHRTVDIEAHKDAVGWHVASNRGEAYASVVTTQGVGIGAMSVLGADQSNATVKVDLGPVAPRTVSGEY